MRFGVVPELMGEGMQPGVLERVRESLAILEKLGATIEEVSLPSFAYGIDAYYLIAPAEASSNLARTTERGTACASTRRTSRR